MSRRDLLTRHLDLLDLVALEAGGRLAQHERLQTQRIHEHETIAADGTQQLVVRRERSCIFSISPVFRVRKRSRHLLFNLLQLRTLYTANPPSV